MTKENIRRAAEQYYKQRFPNSLAFDYEIIFAFEAAIDWYLNNKK